MKKGDAKNKKEGAGIHQGCISFGYITSIIILVVAIFSSSPLQDYLFVVFFFVMGSSCGLHYKSTGRVHCQITGYGFLGVGVIALLKVLEIINISWNIIWWIVIALLVVAFGLEFLHKKKIGCIVKISKENKS